jgi:hypothetical protein
MFRRPIRRAIRHMTASAVNQNAFFQANQFYGMGQFEAAADSFIQLAHQMEKRGKPRQAANLHAQAALALAKAGIEPRALNQANIAFSQFTLLGMRQRVSEFKAELDRTLHPNKVSTSTDTPIQSNINPEIRGFTSATENRRGKLPATCHQCGAPVRSNQVEWIDDSSAECDFCGAVLQTE